MKTITFIIAILLPSLAFSQFDWRSNGNAANASSFIGTTNGFDFPIYTDGDEKMRVTTTGEVGIGVTNPDMRLHVDSGGVLVTNDIGSNPNLGAGYRLMYIPEDAAFRGGQALGSEWDGTDVGQFSFAYGRDVTASDLSTFAFGQELEVTASYSNCFGFNNNATNTHVTLFGQNNNGSGVFSFAAGKNLNMTGDFNTALGCDIEISSDNGMVFGSGLNGNPLTNAINNSLMVGFNSNLSGLELG